MERADMTRQPPIGYWLKHLDEVITKHTDLVLKENGFTRSRWQTLNIIYQEGNLSRQKLFATMQTFLNSHQLDEIVSEFIKKGWLVQQGEGDDIQLATTENGKVEREITFTLQSEVRKRLMQGVTEQEYTIVIDVLQRMVKNLE